MSDHNQNLVPFAPNSLLFTDSQGNPTTTGSPPGPTLNQVLLAGNDAGALSIQNLHFINDSANVTSIDVFSRRLHSGDASLSIDYASRTLFDPAGLLALDYTSRVLSDGVNRSVDWANRVLFDAADLASVLWNDRMLKDAAGGPSVNWEARTLHDATSTDSIDWDARLLWDTFEQQSADWENRILKDAVSGTSLDWANRTLTDSSGSLSFDYQNRQLLSASTVVLEYVASSVSFFSAAAYILATGDIGATGNISITTAGKGLKIKEGANAKMGLSTLVAGVVVVSNTSVDSSSRIFLTPQNSSGTVGSVRITSKVAGTSFTITSSSLTDTSTIAWQIIEAA